LVEPYLFPLPLLQFPEAPPPAPGRSDADLTGAAGGERLRTDAGGTPVDARCRFGLFARVWLLAMRISTGSPGQIRRRRVLLFLAVCTAASWWRRASHASNKALLRWCFAPWDMPPSSVGHGGEGGSLGRCLFVPLLPYGDALPTLPLSAGHGGEGRRGSCGAVTAGGGGYGFCLLPQPRGDRRPRWVVPDEFQRLKMSVVRLQANPWNKCVLGARASFVARCFPLFLLASRGGVGGDIGGSEWHAWLRRSGEFRSFPFRRNFSRCSDHLCPPSPTRGRSVVLECRSLVSFNGACEEYCVGDFRSLEVKSAGIIRTVACRQSKPVSSGICLTSIGGLFSGQRPRPTSALKQVVPSARRCS